MKKKTVNANLRLRLFSHLGKVDFFVKKFPRSFKAFLVSFPRKRDYALLRYTFAVVIVWIVTSLTLSFKGSPFILVFSSVVISAWFGSFGAGIIATVFSALMIAYFFLPPTNSFAILHPADALRLAAYIVEGLFFSIFAAMRRRAEKQLQAARDYSETIINTIQIPLIVLDNKLSIVKANNAFYTFFKLSERNGYLLIDRRSSYQELLRARKKVKSLLLRKKPFKDITTTYEFPSIGRKVLSLRANQFKRDGANYTLVSILDLTQQRETELQKNAFLAMATHELKTPVTTIKGYVQILQKSLQNNVDKKMTYFINNISANVDKLLYLINDLVDVSKIQVGKLELYIRRFDIDSLVKKVIIDFQYMTSTHTIVKRGDVHEIIKGDRDRIEQVLINLIGNAIKYSPTANSVIVTLAKNKDYITVSVQDFGIGISEEYRSRIFDRFFRVSHQYTNKYEGTGLGLFIVREIIKRHKGKIWLESEVGKGSTFFFTLPRSNNLSLVQN